MNNPLLVPTPELIAKLKEILATNTVRDVGTPYPTDIPLAVRSYWRVSSGAFTTIVSFLDAKTAEEATKLSIEDKFQPWYLCKSTEAPSVEPITHSQYVDWLRR